MIEGTLSYNTGLIYEIKFELDDQAIEKTLRTIFGDSYSDMKKQLLIKTIGNALTFTNPTVKKKWTTLKKESTGEENLKWKQKQEVMSHKAPVIQTERYL